MRNNNGPAYPGMGTVSSHVLGGNTDKIDTVNAKRRKRMLEMLDCGHPPSPHSHSTTGYGTQDGKKYCYECCAKLDMEDMRQTGRAVLYLVSNNRAVINWPGTLIIPVEDLTIGKHNVARTRYDIWFNFEGWEWWGVKYGEDTELVHCRRTKRKA